MTTSVSFRRYYHKIKVLQTATIKRMQISSWSVEDRPIEKIQELGINALTDAVLLSMIIGISYE